VPVDKARALIRAAARAPHYVENQRIIRKSLEITEQSYLSAVSGGVPDQVVVQNVMYFAALYNYDLSVLLEELDSAPSDWHERLYGRVLALTVYECLEDLPGLLGRSFRSTLASWGIATAQSEELNAIGKALSAQKSTDASWLNEVRTNAIGHRHQVAIDQMRYIRDLDLVRIDAAASELFSWTNRLYALLTRVLEHRLSTLRSKRKDA